MHTYNNILSFFLLVSFLALASCSGSGESGDAGEPQQQCPIAFAFSEEPQQAVTRAAATLGRDFVVYGYKSVGDQPQTVFDGYTVKYQENSAHTSEDNTHNYYYVQGTQSIKYWDFAASDYHFWGIWKSADDKASFSGTYNNVITIPDVTLFIGDHTSSHTDYVLFSSLAERRPVTADVVQLGFKRPNAKVRVMFYTTEPLQDNDQVPLTGISFVPDANASSTLVNKIYKQGKVVVTYPMPNSCSGNAQEGVVVSDYQTPLDALLFKSITLKKDLGISSNTAVTAPVDYDNSGDDFGLGDMTGTPLSVRIRKAGEKPDENYYYYPLPMGNLNPAFTMNVTVNGYPRTAVVPATYMQWKPNYIYTYIFKISEVEWKVELYDVKIEPWHYGGSQTDEWKNW